MRNYIPQRRFRHLFGIRSRYYGPHSIIEDRCDVSLFPPSDGSDPLEGLLKLYGGSLRIGGIRRPQTNLETKRSLEPTIDPDESNFSYPPDMSRKHDPKKPDPFDIVTNAARYVRKTIRSLLDGFNGP